MNIKFYILLLVAVQFIFSESIAVTSKTKGDVRFKKKNEKELKNQLKAGVDLFNNDYIKTGSDGFAKYVYLDDGTQIKIHNNSEVYIRGVLEQRAIVKQLKVEDGTVKLDVKKQNVDEFTVITPTSVASVKGTSFWLDCQGKSGDKFYGESGTVGITNIESGIARSLKKNTVAQSLPDGSLDVRAMTQEELNMLQEIEQDAGESENPEEGNNNNLPQDEIKIEFEDESGNQKIIIIKIQ